MRAVGSPRASKTPTAAIKFATVIDRAVFIG